jgi:glutamyl-tRNA reductase
VAIVAVGYNEREMSLDVFEDVAITGRDLAKALRIIRDRKHISEAVVLSTCLRIEVYAVVDRLHDGIADIEDFFCSCSGSTSRDISVLSGQLSCWIDDTAISHLFDVAAGIDSSVPGEGEILRYVRNAAELARAEHAAGRILGSLFSHAIEAGERVQTEMGTASGTGLLARAAVGLAEDQLGGGLGGQAVLVVGAGVMAAAVCNALAQSVPPASVVVANRTVKRAARVARESGAKAVSLSKLGQEMKRADVVLSATASSQAVLGLERIERIMRSRPGRPLLAVDLAIPRDVDPAVAGVDGVSLFDLGDIRRHAKTQMTTRQVEVQGVRLVLAEELERYRYSSPARSVAPVVAALQTRAEAIRQAEIDRQRARLTALGPEATEIVETITRRTVAKLLHEPTVRAKEAAGSPRGDRLAEALRNLFDL